MNDEYTVIPLPLWFCIVVALLFSCAGCTSTPPYERYMTDEQDAEMRESCEPHGCTVIPNPIWFQMREILKRSGAI